MWPWSKSQSEGTPKSETASKLDTLIKRRADILDETDALEEELYEVECQLQTVVLEIVQKNKEIAPHLCREEDDEAYSAEDFAVGYHECTGPVGVCVYDTVGDYGSDCCIFCSQPEERK